MPSVLTKQQIQEEYDKLIPTLGTKTYQLLVPVLEIVALVQRGMHLSQEMYRIQTEEAACQKTDAVALKVVESVDTK